jgi:hypothetical protein
MYYLSAKNIKKANTQKVCENYIHRINDECENNSNKICFDDTCDNFCFEE